LDPGDEDSDILFGTGFGGITDVEVGPDGYLYVLTFQDDGGSIFRIVPADLDTDGDDTDEVEVEEEVEVEVEVEPADDTGVPSLARILAERTTEVP
jgi:hypothetical protein